LASGPFDEAGAGVDVGSSVFVPGAPQAMPHAQRRLTVPVRAKMRAENRDFMRYSRTELPRPAA
jgi:hypothetical protein